MVHAWYNEINEPGYDFAKATFTGGTGHFTQVVWKGCGSPLDFLGRRRNHPCGHGAF